jgi:hypothetical protein
MNMQSGFLKFTLLLSILVGIIPPVFHERFLDKNEIDVTLPDHWNRMSTEEKWGRLRGLLSKNDPFFLLSEIRQLNIRRHLKKMIVDKEDDLLKDGFHYSFGFHFDLGKEELGLLGLAGFASVWILYVFTRAVIFLIPSVLMHHFPLPPLRWQIRLRHFRNKHHPASFLGVKITLFNFLVREEEPKRPAKPRAVWID